MFDLVPFTGAGWEVSDGDGKTSLISQFLKFEFPKAKARSVAAAAKAFQEGGLTIEHA